MKRRTPATATLLVVTFVAAACGDDSREASVQFTAPAGGATASGAIDVRMSSEGIAIEPAGEVREGAGHYHVIVDAGCVEPGEAIGSDADHLHFGNGASDAVIYLEPGEHDLCLQVGDGQHTALGITDTIDIEVAITDRDEWCSVLIQTDAVMASLGDHDFAVAQTNARNGGRLVQQLSAAPEHVDAEARPAVEQLLSFVAGVLDAYVTAGSAAEAESRAWGEAGVSSQYSEDELAAIENASRTWIVETCDVDVFD